jgi:hypothetical protein
MTGIGRVQGRAAYGQCQGAGGEGGDKQLLIHGFLHLEFLGL